jgi:SAM-dependent methyltransferase
MSDWTSGYVADIGYTYGYYTELNPLRVKLAFLHAGLVAPEMGTACELGFGQGLSTVMHAAASVVHWCGTDFNPAQAGFAQELERVSESGARLYDEAFDQFCSRDDLPEFDYIGLHGIWSWVSDANRAIIVDFIRRKLKVGGVLYISYNTQPGWAPMVPMRDLLTQHAEVMGSDGAGIVSRIDGALAFADKLLAANPSYAIANPQVATRINKIKEQNRHYVAHEYFNRDWQPMSFAKMAEWLSSAKVDWACSAAYTDAVDDVNLTKDQQELLKGITDPLFKQTVRDFCTNQQFRKDYWVKGVRQITPLDKTEEMRNQRLILSQLRSDVSMSITSQLGVVTLQDPIYVPILDILADYKPRSIGQIEQELKTSETGKHIKFGQLIQALMVLSGTGALLPAQHNEVVNKLKTRTDKLNDSLMTKSRSSAELSYLASPVTGGGIAVGRFDQIFLLARSQGQKQPADWAQYAWKFLAMQNQRLTKEGQVIDSPEDNIKELTARATEFAEKRLPLLKALQIA